MEERAAFIAMPFTPRLLTAFLRAINLIRMLAAHRGGGRGDWLQRVMAVRRECARPKRRSKGLLAQEQRAGHRRRRPRKEAATRLFRRVDFQFFVVPMIFFTRDFFF